MKENDYNTALIGKYHLGSPHEPQNGFDHWFTFPHGHTRSFWGNTFIDNGRFYTDECHSVDVFTEKAVEYLENYADESPFFMFLTYNGPYGHWPAIHGEPRNALSRLPDEQFSTRGIEQSGD